MTRYRKTNIIKNNSIDILFLTFCVWVFVMLGRPQDYFVELSAIRPVVLSTLLMAFVYLINIKNINGSDVFNSSQLKNYILLYFIMIFGVPASLYVRASFEYVLTDYILVVMFVVTFYKVVNSIERLKVVLRVSCFGAGVYFFMALRSGLGDFSRLAFGSMFDPNDLAYFALVFLPLYFFFLGKDNMLVVRLFSIVFLSSGVLLILLSGSRGGVLALGLSLVVFLLMTKSMKRSIKVLVLIGCAIFITLAPINIERYSTIFNIEDDYNVTSEEGRIGLWKIGIRALINNPITGVGVGSYSIAVGLDRQSRQASTQAWQTAHNSVIQIGTETGIFGLVLFLSLSFNILKIFNNIRKRSQQAELVKVAELGLVGFFGMFTAGMFLSQAYSIYWAFYIAFSAIAYQLYFREISTRSESKKHA